MAHLLFERITMFMFKCKCDECGDIFYSDYEWDFICEDCNDDPDEQSDEKY